MFRVALALALAFAVSAPADGAVPLSVTSAPEEQQARRLASALFRQLQSDPRFTVVGRPAPGVLNLALPARVGWERRLDWTEILFQARLSSSDGQSRVVAGRCYNWNMSDCAKQILDAAARAAGH